MTPADVAAAFAPIRARFEEACEQARREWPWVADVPPGSTLVVETEIVGETLGDIWDGYVWNGKAWVDAADFSWPA